MILESKIQNSVNFNSKEIEESKQVILLGITINNLINFNGHIDNICLTTNNKLHAFQRIRNSLAGILQTLTFAMHNFLWLDIVLAVKSAKLSNVAMLVLLGIRRNVS